ncbi:bark storage protein A-like [Humulus lupulus]|uniref:bark storage protein A-like n=1 Tax=Humulus lupulus TaxID=3486 RepID=UPI002B400812|nr:bark storage protein A-like [Humulus lupulus]
MEKCLVMVVLISVMIFSAIAVPRKGKLNHIIREANDEGPYIGLITVISLEEAAIFATGAFKPHPKHPFLDLSGRRFRVGKIHDKKVIYVRCGAGMANAVAATQQMVDVFEIVGIVHFGIAGNANNSMSIGDVTIPKQLAHTALWDWVNPNGGLPANDVAELDFKSYNVPIGEDNLLGHIGFSSEQFFSDSQKPGIDLPLFWANVSHHWLQLATKLEGMELEQCVNRSSCLEEKPKVVVGLRASTSNIFVDNAAYRNFLSHTLNVSSVDMESSAVVMTSLSNGFPVIVIRGLSDLAGSQSGPNVVRIFGSLAALNAAKAVLRFLDLLPTYA